MKMFKNKKDNYQNHVLFKLANIRDVITIIIIKEIIKEIIKIQ